MNERSPEPAYPPLPADWQSRDLAGMYAQYTRLCRDGLTYSRWMHCDPAVHPCRWVPRGDGVRCLTCGSGFTDDAIERLRSVPL